MSGTPDLRARVEQEAHIAEAKVVALELVTDLGLSEEAASEVVEAVGSLATEPQEEANPSCERLLGLARVLGWHVRGYPPALPFDSNIGGKVIFDARTEDTAFKSPKKGGLLDLTQVLTADAKSKLTDTRVSQVIRFVGKLFDEAYGFDTPSLVTRSGDEEQFKKEELRHLDFGSFLKAAFTGMTHQSIANQSRFSRPTMYNIQNDFIPQIVDRLPSDQPSQLLEQVLAVNEPVRILFRYRAPF